MLNKGERLHNPFNLEKNPQIHWQGEVPKSPEVTFCEFESDLYGLRAGFLNLKNQISEGYNTVEKLVTKYAPPSENDTAAYVKAVCQRMGRNQGDILSFTDLKPLGVSIIHQEQGKCIYTNALIDQALSLAGVETHVDTTVTNGKLSIVEWLRNILAKFMPGKSD